VPHAPDVRALGFCHARQWRECPRHCRWLGDADLRPHIVEDADRQPIPGPTVAANCSALAWLEQKVEVTIASHEGVKADCDQAVGWELAILRLPGRAQSHREPFAMRIPKGIGRNVNPSQAIGRDVINLLIEEREAASHKNALEALLMVDRNIDGHVGLAAFKNSLRIREWRAAPPAPHRPCVARGGSLAISEWACHVERVSICPADVALCFWKNKSVR